MKLTLIAFCAAALFNLPSGFTQSSLKKIDKDLKKIQRDFPFVGFAAGIVKADAVIFSKGYGFGNKEEKKPFTKHTIQPVGSVSKTVVGLALLQAIEQHYFTDETPINDIIAFKVVNPHAPKDTIRVKHLFTHTSGILDNERIYLQTYQLGKRPDCSLADFLTSYLVEGGSNYDRQNFDMAAVGKNYNYSNIASALAAYLVEAASGLSFDQFTDQHIFKPLGMQDTHWFYDEAKAPKYATLYEKSPVDLPHFEQLWNKDESLKIYSCITYPDGSLRTSLSDLEKYVQELMRESRKSSQLVPVPSYSELFQAQFDPENLPENMPKNMVNQAMFWSYNSKNRLIHTGSDPGIFAVVSIDLQNNIGRIVLMNTGVDGDDNEKLIKGLQALSAALEKLN